MLDATDQTHPSYGILQIHRASGGARPLFGSAIRHGNTIRVTIYRASKQRSLSENWYHAKEQIVECELSPVQWANAISTATNTQGVPCTILSIYNQRMPPCPVDSDRELVNKEFSDDMRKLGKKFVEISKEIDGLLSQPRLNKEDKAKLREAVDSAAMFFRNNAQFVHAQFEESVERTVSEAKGEVEAFFSHTVHNLGLQALASKAEAGEQFLIQAPELKDL